MQSFSSVWEIHKAPVSEWSLYFPRLRLSWMFTFSLLQFLVNLKKGNFRRNNLRSHYPHEHRWQGDVWLYRCESQEKLFSPLTPSNIYCQLLEDIEKSLKHQRFVKIHFLTSPYREHLGNLFFTFLKFKKKQKRHWLVAECQWWQ